MAERAARVVALRNLLGRLNQPATAPASQPASGRIQINGVLRGYRFLPTRFLPDGTAEVTVELPLISPQTAPATSSHPRPLAASMPGSSESFPLRENGTIPVWVITGPFPNARITDHGQACFGYFTDHLKNQGGEAEVSPSEGDRVAVGPDQPVTWKAAFSKPSGLLDYGFLQTPPHGDALASRLPIRLGGGLPPPSCQTCSAHKKKNQKERNHYYQFGVREEEE